MAQNYRDHQPGGRDSAAAAFKLEVQVAFAHSSHGGVPPPVAWDDPEQSKLRRKPPLWDVDPQPPGQTTRAPPVGFELATSGIQFYVIAN